MTACPMRPLIDRHFAGRIRPPEEARMREHLPSCERCERCYERHLLLAKLDPNAMSAQERIGAALGLWAPKRRGSVATAAVIAMAACFALFLLRPHDRALEFQARGAPSEPRVWVYRVAPGAKPVQLGEVMSASDELAFAVDNVGEARRLLIFGVDEHRHVYWYHPAWVEATATPTAVPAPAGRHELPEAVSHQLDGSVLTLYAVFTSDSVTVREVERDLDGYARRAGWRQRVRVTR